MVTRRELSNLLLLQGLQPAKVNLDLLLPDLHLSPSELREVAAGGERALREARWLEELPLDGVAPGFIFVPR